MNDKVVKNFSFINVNDELGNLINGKANELYYTLNNLDKESLSGDQWGEYFIQHHLKNRLFFSIQSSALILFESIKISGKKPDEISVVDYGAGLGTLFILGGMLGFKRFDYNDYFPDWQGIAKVVCETVNSRIDSFIIGDIRDVVNHALQNNYQYDIVVSRNVIEHIYSIADFYSSLFSHNPGIIIYSSTTANYANVLTRIQHYFIHKKAENNIYFPQRCKEIARLQPLLKDNKIKHLARITRGRAGADFTSTIESFLDKKTFFKDNALRSNVCDCNTGLWIEHLLTKNEHKAIAKLAGYKLEITPGFWDTHYQFKVANKVAWLLNKLILLFGKERGTLLSPFVNIIAFC